MIIIMIMMIMMIVIFVMITISTTAVVHCQAVTPRPESFAWTGLRKGKLSQLRSLTKPTKATGCQAE